MKHYFFMIAFCIFCIFLCKPISAEPIIPAVTNDITSSNHDPLKESHLLAARTYFEVRAKGKEHEAMYQENNKKILEKMQHHLPCIPKQFVEENYKTIGAFPLEEFKRNYVHAIAQHISESDLLLLNDFYSTHLGKFFIEWRQHYSDDKSSTTIPLDDKMDQEMYSLYAEVVEKERLATMTITANGGTMVSEETLQKNQQALFANIQTLTAPYLNKKGECKK